MVGIMAKIAKSENSKDETFPINEDGSLSLSVIKEMIPGVIGLRYRHNGRLRAVRICSSYFFLPVGVSWDKNVFHCVYDENPEISDEKKVFTNLSTYYELLPYEMIVMGLPDTVKCDEFNKYFSEFGKLSTCELKRDPKTGLCRGYGFIKFTNFDDQHKCINTELKLRDTELYLRLPTYNLEDSICQRRILVSNVTPSVTMIDLLEYFNVFGKISEIFMPVAFVPYAFITFEKSDAVTNVFKFGESHRVFGGFVVAERMNSKQELEDAQYRKDPTDPRRKRPSLMANVTGHEKSAQGISSEKQPSTKNDFSKGISSTRKQCVTEMTMNDPTCLSTMNSQTNSINVTQNSPTSSVNVHSNFNHADHFLSLPQPMNFTIDKSCPPPDIPLISHSAYLNCQPQIALQPHPPNNFDGPPHIAQQSYFPNNVEGPPQMTQQPHPLNNYEGPPPIAQQSYPPNNYDGPSHIPSQSYPPNNCEGPSQMAQHSYHPNNYDGPPHIAHQTYPTNHSDSPQHMIPQSFSSNNFDSRRQMTPQTYIHNNFDGPPQMHRHYSFQRNIDNVSLHNPQDNLNAPTQMLQNCHPQNNMDNTTHVTAQFHPQNSFDSPPRVAQQFYPQNYNDDPLHISQYRPLSNNSENLPQMAQQLHHHDNNVDPQQVVHQLQSTSNFEGPRQISSQFHSNNYFDGPTQPQHRNQFENSPHNAQRFHPQNNLQDRPSNMTQHFPTQNNFDGQSQMVQSQRNRDYVPQMVPQYHAPTNFDDSSHMARQRYFEGPSQRTQELNLSNNLDSPQQKSRQSFEQHHFESNLQSNQQNHSSNNFDGQFLMNGRPGSCYMLNDDRDISPHCRQPSYLSNNMGDPSQPTQQNHSKHDRDGQPQFIPHSHLANQEMYPEFQSPGQHHNQSSNYFANSPSTSQPHISTNNWSIPHPSNLHNYPTNTTGLQSLGPQHHQLNPNLSSSPPTSQPHPFNQQYCPGKTADLQSPGSQSTQSAHSPSTSQTNSITTNWNIHQLSNQQHLITNTCGLQSQGSDHSQSDINLASVPSTSQRNSSTTDVHPVNQYCKPSNEISHSKITETVDNQNDSSSDNLPAGSRLEHHDKDLVSTIQANDTENNDGIPNKVYGEMLPLQLVSDVTMRLLKTCNSESEKKILAKLLMSVMASPAISQSESTPESPQPTNKP